MRSYVIILGSVGALLTGIFASKKVNCLSMDGLIMGRNAELLKRQFEAVLVVMLLSSAVTFIIIAPFVFLGKRNETISPLEKKDAYDADRYGSTAYDNTDVVVTRESDLVPLLESK